ncbi:hypothetical protein ACFL2Q_15615 [Thermodesulfobacteriota bacterium]
MDLANAVDSKDVTRVFVIGGSAAYGSGASSTDTRWYMELERLLSKGLKRQVRLIPAAMGAYVSTQERMVLELIVLPRRPDCVIILNGYNDLVNCLTYCTRPGDVL